MANYSAIFSYVKAHPKVELDGLVICLASLLICLQFFNQYWWGPDDGGYAYVASLLLSGEVLHRDIQDIHPGYIHFINAFFLWLADGDIVGLRWPLVLITVLQSWLAFRILNPIGKVQAYVGAFCMTAFGFLQFINPTPHWYTLALTTLIIYYITTQNVLNFRSLLILGALVGIAFLFRQLTGVILAVAISAYVFFEKHQRVQNNRGITVSLLLAILTLGLVLYLLKNANLPGIILFGVWPALILIRLAFSIRLSFHHTIEIIIPLCIGSLLAMVPIITYHSLHGSLAFWLEDVFITPFTLVAMPFFSKASYTYVPLMALSIFMNGNISGLLGLLYWLPLLIAPMLLGVLLLKNMHSLKKRQLALPLLACFYGLVSVHYEIPIYLNYTISLILIGILSIVSHTSYKTLSTVIIMVFCFVGITIHAAPSVKRTYNQLVTNSVVKEKLAYIPGHSVRIGEIESNHYKDVLSIIDKCTEKNDPIFAFPMSAELYFLSNRKSNLDFFMTSLALQSKNDVLSTKSKIIDENGPALIIHKVEDKYNTALSDQLLSEVKPWFFDLGKYEGYQFYIKNDNSQKQPCINHISGTDYAA